MEICFICGRRSHEYGFFSVKNSRHILVSGCGLCYQEYRMECLRCKTIYLPAWGKDMFIPVCQHCECPSPEAEAESERLFEIERRESHKVSVHLSYARKLDLPAALTARNWCETLRDFNYTCAYCLTAPYEQLDHFIPISKGGPTLPNNCVPACERCNTKKGRRHPDKVTSIPQEALDRVRTYLQSK